MRAVLVAVGERLQLQQGIGVQQLPQLDMQLPRIMDHPVLVCQGLRRRRLPLRQRLNQQRAKRRFHSPRGVRQALGGGCFQGWSIGFGSGHGYPAGQEVGTHGIAPTAGMQRVPRTHPVQVGRELGEVVIDSGAAHAHAGDKQNPGHLTTPSPARWWRRSAPSAHSRSWAEGGEGSRCPSVEGREGAVASAGKKTRLTR